MTDLSNNNCITTESMNKYKFDDIQTIFNRPELLIKFFHRYSYFYSDIIKKWIFDYYQFQSKVIIDNYVNNKYEDIIINIPSYTGSFIWFVKEIKNNIKFNWDSNHIGMIDLSINNMKGIFFRLKSLFENNKRIFDIIIPTKYDIEFTDECKIIVKGLQEKRHFNIMHIRGFFLGLEEAECLKTISTYIKRSYYVSVDELGTEMTYITDCIYGFSNLMIRTGLNLESDTDIINAMLKLNKEDNKTSDKDDDNTDNDDADSDDTDSYDSEDDDIYVMDNQALVKDFNLYHQNSYCLNDEEYGRNSVFKNYGDKSYELLKHITSDNSQDNSQDNVPDYISNYEDLKELTVMLYFFNDKDKFSEFCEKYKKDGIFSTFSSIGQVEHCCKNFANNTPFEQTTTNVIYDIENENVRDIFNIAFNDSNNFIAQKVKEQYMSQE